MLVLLLLARDNSCLQSSPNLVEDQNLGIAECLQVPRAWKQIWIKLYLIRRPEGLSNDFHYSFWVVKFIKNQSQNLGLRRHQI